MSLYSLTIEEASKKLADGETTAVELTEAVINRTKALESKVGAYITLTEEKAYEMAKASDERRRAKKPLSEIDGVPLAIKDLFLTKGVKTTAASKILEDFIPAYESTVTSKLWASGAVLIGKTNLDQFAMGSSTETSAYKTATDYNSTTRNPWDLERVPGGSSGGSAAAVAADMCIGAIGTDTGGSIRQPASLCGITGIKPTYGRVSRYGTIAMASSLDQAGPMTKSVKDAAIMLERIAGWDSHDSTASKKEVPHYSKSLNGDIKGLKIGVPKEFFEEGLEPGIREATDDALKVLENLGAKVVSISMPMLKHALAVYYILMPAEVSSNLARYDGIRYGLSVLKNKDFKGTIEEVYEMSREEGFGAEAKRRIMLGSYVLSAGYYEAYYKKAQKVRTLVKREFENMFKNVDVIASPVTPTAAFKFGEKLADPLSMYLSDIMTVPANPAGIPALAFPCGFSQGLPVGMQILGPVWSEQMLFNIGYAFQQNTSFHEKKPKL